MCRHIPVGPYRASSPIIRRQASVRCKPLFGRCYLCHTDNGKEGSGQALRIIRKIRRNRLVVTSASTGRYLGIDWSMQLNRPHDPFATTGRYPGIDWSMQLNRPHDPPATTGQYLDIDWSILASTSRYLGIDWSIPQHRLINLGIDWSMQGMAGTRKSGVCKELIY